MVSFLLALLVGSGQRPPPLVDLLVGRWTSSVVHWHADGSSLHERGVIECEWILARRYLLCDRRYTADTGANRHSMQLYAVSDDGTVAEVMTLYEGSTSRALQSVRLVPPTSLELTGLIQVGGRQLRTRGMMTIAAITVSYRNETEEAPGRWRVDYEETYSRRP